MMFIILKAFYIFATKCVLIRLEDIILKIWQEDT